MRFLLAAVLLIGCTTHFQPGQRAHVQAGDLGFDLRGLRSSNLGEQFHLDAEAGRQRTLHAAWLTDPLYRPCRGGVQAVDLRVDDGGPTLPAGQHHLSAEFPAQALNLSTVLDVLTTEGDCLRLPVASPTAPLVVDDGRFVLGISLDVALNTPLASGFGGVAGGGLSGGVWAGRTLLSLAALVGPAACRAAVCGSATNGGTRYGLGVPLMLEARRPVSELPFAASANDLSLGVRYALTPAWLPAPGGPRSIALHQLQALLALDSYNHQHSRAVHRERSSTSEYALALGVLYDPSGSAKHVGFTVGVSARLLTPL